MIIAELAASLDMVHVAIQNRLYLLTIAVDRVVSETILAQDRHLVTAARSGVGAVHRSSTAVQGVREPLAHATEPFATIPTAVLF